MANGNVKIDATPDTLAAVADVLGSAHPDDYQSVFGTPVKTVDPSLRVNLMRRPEMSTVAAPTIQGLGSQLTMTPYQRMSLSVAPQSPDTITAPMRSPMLGRIPPATNTAIVPPAHQGFFGKVGGVLGKIGHVAGKVAEVAGDVLAPEVVQNIPGTALNNEMAEHQQQRRDTLVAQNALRKAQTDEAEARANSLGGGDESQQDVIKAYSNALATGDTEEAARLGPLAKQFIEDTEKQRQEGKPELITTEGGELSTLGPDNTLRPVMTPPQATAPISAAALEGPLVKNAPIPGGTLPISAPIAPEQASGVSKLAPSTEPKTDEEIAITDRLAKLGMENTPQNRDSVRLQIRKEMAEANRKPEDSTARDLARSDKSYQYHNNALDKIQTPIDQVGQRLGRLEDTLNQRSPQADALVAPELLSIMAGGQGSGIRMNEAEIARIVGGRSQWEALKASINKWNTDPKEARSIIPEQDRQIRALVATVAQKLAAKRQILDQARETLVNSDDPRDHKQALMNARKSIDAIDSGQQGGGEPAVGTIEGGYKYKGGGAHNKANWEKVK